MGTKGAIMKSGLVIALGIGILAGQVYAQDVVLKTQKDKVSYSIGMDIGMTLKNQSLEVDPAILARGIKDSMTGQKPLMTEQEIRDTIGAFQKEMMAKQQELAKQMGEKNKKEGEVFLAENKKKEGVKTLASGLQYKVIKAGTGKKPKATDTVTTHYRGTLVDGTEFDSSARQGKPATFQVKGVIPGWTEALQLMEEGAKWQLFIPSNLAYGERGTQGGPIGPNAALIFDIELISIQGNK
jgi:FKBP-type peptidyl-prolyl cis-trans isomerase FklB